MPEKYILEHQEPTCIERTGSSMKSSGSHSLYDTIVEWFKNHSFFGPVILVAISSSFVINLALNIHTVLNLSSAPKHNTIQSTCTDFSFYEWATKYNGLTDVEAKQIFRDQDNDQKVCGTFRVTNVKLNNNHSIVSLVDLEESEIKSFLDVEFQEKKGASLKIGEKIYFSGKLFNVQKDRSPVKPQELITVFQVKASKFENKIDVPSKEVG